MSFLSDLSENHSTLLDPKHSSSVEVNPMVVGMKNSQCPIDGICAHIASGFGTIAHRCEYLNEVGDDLYCKHKDTTDKMFDPDYTGAYGVGR
jgi:hypothetical protein